MKKKNDLLISFASWEDRFTLGFEHNVENSAFRSALVFYFRGYSIRTNSNRKKVAKICDQKGISCALIDLNGEDPVDTWRTVRQHISKAVSEYEGILVDISTMPRDIIWYVLSLVDSSQVAAARYVYYEPEGYGKWLSQNPRSPRLVFKLSGLASPISKVTLVVTVGFDLPRVTRLIDWCEPNRIIIGCQVGTRFPANEAFMDKYRELGRQYPCTFFDLDAHAEDSGLSSIREALVDVGEDDYVLLSSLGPKITAVSLYKIRRENERYGLVYAPSSEFSSDYSFGIGRSFGGNIR